MEPNARGATPVIEPAALEALRRPLFEADNLPPECYYHEDAYQREVERIFMKEWVCVGRAEDIPTPGNYFTTDIAGQSIIVVRDGEGAIRAHLNACRHRGAELVEGAANGECRTEKAFRCPYHGWMYALTGELRATPEFKEVQNFDGEAYCLLSARTEVWNGFIMVNLSRDATSFTDGVSETTVWGADRYHMDTMVTVHRADFQVAANWKTLCENAVDDYHLPWVHADTFNAWTPVKGYVEFPDISEQPWALLMAQFPGYSYSDSGTPLFSVNEDVSDMPPEYDGMPICLLFPSLVVNPTVDMLAALLFLPEGPDGTRMQMRICIPEADAAALEDGEAGVAEALEEYVRNVEKATHEDNEVCEKVQRGIKARGLTPGRYGRREGLVRKFSTWVASTAYHGDLITR